MNKYDSGIMARCMEEEGCLNARDVEDADIIVINTCSVRKHAEERMSGFTSGLKRLKKKNPGLVIILCGCTAQREGARLLEEFPHVDIIIGTERFSEIAAALDKRLSGGGRAAYLSPRPRADTGGLFPSPGNSAVSFVTAMRGCSNYCSYCVVPYLRGGEKSRTPESLAEETRFLAGRGVKEICLLGQNVLAYGRDLPGGEDFPSLLAALDSVPGIERLRFLSSHPKDLTDDIIAAVAGTASVCESIHLPVQSGSTRVLKLMRRGYSRQDYLELAYRLRSRIPDIAITTDIMAGFPGETEADFALTLKLMEEVRFDDAFLYRYSPRKGTEAFSMGGRDCEKAGGERLSALISLQKKIAGGRNRLLLGKETEVLVEGESRRTPGMVHGKTRTGKNVVFRGDGTLRGELIRVRITETGPATLLGEIARGARAGNKPRGELARR